MLSFFPGRTGPGNRMRGFGVGSSVKECLSLAGDRFLVAVAVLFLYKFLCPVNRIELNCIKSLIPFHALWGLCWYNFSFRQVSSDTTPKNGLQNDTPRHQIVNLLGQVTPAACRYSPAVDIYALGLVDTDMFFCGQFLFVNPVGFLRSSTHINNNYIAISTLITLDSNCS